MSVAHRGQQPFAYQWYRDGQPLAGATSATLQLSQVTAGDAGTYTVRVQNALGSVTSNGATVRIAAASDMGRLINLSARARAGSDAKTLIVGLVLSGEGEVPLLIRGVGPTLDGAPYNVASALADPRLSLFNRSGTLITANDNWGGDAALAATMRRVGAFALRDAASKDAALLRSLSAGPHTAHVVAASGPGVALAEFYDTRESYAAGAARLVNISARSEVGAGDDVLIAGFVIGGSTEKTVLVRGVGAQLAEAPFNLQGVLADPQIALHNSKRLLAGNDDWSSGADADALAATMAQVGAYPLTRGSKDAAMVVSLPPGAYTVIVSGKGNASGVALAEVYEVR